MRKICSIVAAVVVTSTLSRLLWQFRSMSMVISHGIEMERRSGLGDPPALSPHESTKENSDGDLRIVVDQRPLHKHKQHEYNDTRTKERLQPPRSIIIKADERESHFWTRTDQCYEINNVCYNRKKGGDGLIHTSWFYFANDEEEVILPLTTPKQPNLILGDTNRRIRIYINTTVTSSIPKRSELSSYDNNTNQCIVSLIPNHVVVQSVHNHMMGEFMLKSYLALTHLMIDSATYSSFNNNSGIQFYLHMGSEEHEQNAILDSHKLYFAGLPYSGQGAKSFGDIFDDKGSSQCECFDTLVFCGYKEYRKEHSTTLIPDERIVVQNRTCKADYLESSEQLMREECQVWADMKKSLTSSLERNNPHLEEEIAAYRTRLIRNAVANFSSTEIRDIDEEEWTVIGLTQRYLRTWIHLNETLAHCNKSYHAKQLVCVEVNVDDLSPVNSIVTKQPLLPEDHHLILHRSLNGLVGIHGSQLTQGLLMKSGSVVVELLPWFRKKIWGAFTSSVKHPTPMGVMFHNTDINEVGYRLKLNSIPQCMNKPEGELDNCLKLMRWNIRDFVVELEMVERFVGTFFPSKLQTPGYVGDITETPLCSDLRKRGESNNFVLYNVWCRENDDTDNVKVQHYYLDRNSWDEEEAPQIS
mmetsp:Transcript_20673/g.44672  ORF Transcript_20673/g.44672 Transcript_20673/m.44672 type:complete len:641 (-) Transcript_20673:346-2268(-)